MAIVVLIPGPLGRRLNRLRARLDGQPSDGLPGHIPLVGPFRAEPSFLPLEQHCWQVCHGTAPFSVELDVPAVDEGEGLVSARIAAGRDELFALREALLTGRYAPPRDETPYEPRTLIARLERADDAALARREIAAAEASGSFFLERVELMARYPDGTWYERDFYTLDRATTRA